VITRSGWLELLALTLILLLAAYLRLANVAANPAWYTDEGTHLEIARHLLHGQVQYLAVDQSWLLFSRLPLFELLLSGAALVGGVSMLTLRTLSGSLGAITVAALYLIVRHMTRDVWLALLAALLLAIYPPAVLYSRFGFSYNLLAPLVLIAFIGIEQYDAGYAGIGARSAGFLYSRMPARAWSSQKARRRWLAVSALAVGLGALSDLWMLIMLAPFVLMVLIRNWRDVLWSLPLALLPFGIYAAIMLSTIPQAFLFDLRFVLSRVNQLALDRQVATLWQNISTLAAQDTWLIAGSIGLMLLQPPRLRWIAVAFFAIPIALLGRTTALFSLSFYYLIPLLPFIALGVASFIRKGAAWLAGRFGQRASRPVIAALGVLLAVALLSSTLRLVAQVRDVFRTDIDGFLLTPGAAHDAAEFVNRRVTPDDLIIASPALAWMLLAQTADIQMPFAYQGRATPHLPGNLPLERWAFDPNVERARFVIVDNLWRNWAVPNVPGVADLLQGIEAWPVVLRSGEVVIYQNPED
jgi:4-amino-4-deoxy-L-arabinose transferase-like glycosyltransferase